ncbi:MAG: hypothetical protein GC164_05145 [Phycisphaera sp.]|nr:hypothetical protein [Phycisphaera sp.]
MKRTRPTRTPAANRVAHQDPQSSAQPIPVEPLEPRLLLSAVEGTSTNLFEDLKIGVGNGPEVILTADLDGDNDPDLVTANTSDNSITVLLNNGDGTFAQPVPYFAHNAGLYTGLDDIAIGDVDGDDIPDIIAIEDLLGDLVIFTGNGDGTFVEPTSSINITGSITSLHLEDLNHDEILDVFYANHDNDRIAVMIGNGDGTFGSETFYSVGDKPINIATGFFNDDNLLDLAVANETSDDVSILIAQMGGGFAAEVRIDTGFGTNWVDTGDIDHNGTIDLAVSNIYGINLYIGVGDGTFTFDSTIDYYNSSDRVYLEDLDGDNLPEIINRDFLSDHGVWWNLGSLEFSPQRRFTGDREDQGIAFADFNLDGRTDAAVAVDYSRVELNDAVVIAWGGAGGFFLAANQRLEIGDARAVVAVGDVNGDGLDDIITPHFSLPQLSVFIASPLGGFLTEQTITVDDNQYDLALADVDGDNDLDLIGTDTLAGGMLLMFNNGNGTFTTGTVIGSNTPQKIVAQDADGDEIVDIVALDGNILFYKGNNDGTFEAPVNVTADSNWFDIAVGDVTGDDLPDVVAVRGSENIAVVFVNQGDGTYSPATPLATVEDPHTVALGDFDEDGVLDIVAGGDVVAAGYLSVFLSLGGGNFNVLTPIDIDRSADGLAVRDMDLDGHADIVAALGNSGEITVVLGDGQGSFVTQYEFFTGDGADDVAIADVNKDGFADIVSISTFDDFVNVLDGALNDGFRRDDLYSVGEDPRSIVAGDLNNDGHVDAVTGNYDSDDISVLLNDGEGGFLPSTSYSAVDKVTDLVLAHLNNDTYLDIVAVNYAADSISVYLNLGDGTFGPMTEIAVGGSPQQVVAGLVNNDAFVDLLVINSDNYPDPKTVSVLLGNGNGTFTVGTPISGFDGDRLALGDVNKDNVLDVVIPDYDSVDVYLGNNDGTFTPSVMLPLGAESFAFFESVTIGDADADTNPDILAANSVTGTLYLYRGLGNGAFDNVELFRVGNSPGKVFIDDINNDNVPDIITINTSSDDISVILGNGDGTFDRERRYGVSRGMTGMTLADVDQDGDLDALVTDAVSVDSRFENVVRIKENLLTPLDYGDAPDTYRTTLANNGARHAVESLRLGTNIDEELEGLATGAALGDDNNNTDDEDGVTFLSSIKAGQNATIRVNASATAYLNAWIDFNDDGDFTDEGEQVFTDLSLASGNNDLQFAVPDSVSDGSTFARFRLSTVKGLAPTGFAPNGEVEDYIVYTQGSPAIPTKSDFNADGYDDIVFRNASNGLNVIWLMQGATKVGSVGLPTVPDTHWTIAATGDMDMDGDPDIVWHNTSNGLNIIWTMNGTSKSGSVGLPTVADTGWTIVGVGDFNADDKNDIVWRNTSNGNNIVWYMNGTTKSGSAGLPRVADTNWQIVGVDDFNNDGMPDLLWRNVSNGLNIIWTMNGTSKSGSVGLPTLANTDWIIAGVLDSNADGKPDILWRNQSSGLTIVWTMNGTSKNGSLGLPTVSSVWEAVV